MANGRSPDILVRWETIPTNFPRGAALATGLRVVFLYVGLAYWADALPGITSQTLESQAGKPDLRDAMFTGLVEGVGRVERREADGEAIRLVIAVPPALLEDGECRIGESVAINGCCLSAIAVDVATWTFQAGTETLSKTTLGALGERARLNLERALPATGRLGGHFVQGHIDGVGTIAAVELEGGWVAMTIALPEGLAGQIVPKGSIAVDGVSLTVVEVSEASFSIALIPHTLSETTLGERRVGDRVNLETDIIGKYVARQLANERADIDQDSPRNDTEDHGIV